MNEYDPVLHKEWADSWDAVMNQRAPKERPIEKPLPIMNRRTDERTEYKKRPFKKMLLGPYGKALLSFKSFDFKYFNLDFYLVSILILWMYKQLSIGRSSGIADFLQ